MNPFPFSVALLAGTILPQESPQGSIVALLAGVRDYEVLSDLRGPVNDVELFSRALSDLAAFHSFSYEETRLVSGAEKDHRPTLQNILDALDALARRELAPTDRIVVFLAGHGTQVPDEGGDEADGLDEAFLTENTRLWDADEQELPGALLDDVLAEKLSKLTGRCPVWLVVDSCHSGTVERGVKGVAYREVSPSELGIPTHEAQLLLRRRRLHADPPEMADDLRRRKGFVVFTAVRSSVRAPERLLPDPKDNVSRFYGVFTHRLADLLARSRGTETFQELARSLRLSYEATGDTILRPTASGDLDREILTGVARRPRYAIERNPNEELILDAGLLHGIEKGSVFRVQRDTRTIDVRVVEVQLDRAHCEPVDSEIQLHDVVTSSTERVPAELVEAPLQRKRLSVWSDEQAQPLLHQSDGQNWFEVVDAAKDADWALESGELLRLVKLRDEAQRAYWIEPELLVPSLMRVWRVTNLLQLAADGRFEGLPEGVEFGLEIRLPGALVPLPTDGSLQVGQRIGLRYSNSTDIDYRLWIILIDEALKIDSVSYELYAHTEPTSPDDGFFCWDDTIGPGYVLAFVTEETTESLKGLEQGPLEVFEGFPYRKTWREGESRRRDSGFEVTRGQNSKVLAFLAELFEPTRSGSSSFSKDVRLHFQLLPYTIEWRAPRLDWPLDQEPYPRPAELDLDQLGLGDLPVELTLGSRCVDLADKNGVVDAWIIGDDEPNALLYAGPEMPEPVQAGAPIAFRPRFALMVADSGWVALYDTSARGAPELDLILVDSDGDLVAETRYEREADGTWHSYEESRSDLIRVWNLGHKKKGKGATERIRELISGVFSAQDLEHLVAELTPHSPLHPPLSGSVVSSLAESQRPTAKAYPERSPDGSLTPRVELTRGIVELLQDDPRRIRAILAHELAHLSLGHFKRPDLAGEDLRLFHSRQQEHEADLEAVRILERAGHRRTDLVDVLRALNAWERREGIGWFQTVTGDHASPLMRIALLDPNPDLFDAMARFELGLAYLECRAYRAAVQVLEEAALMEPALFEASFDAARAELQDYYAHLPRGLSGTWLRPDFGPLLTDAELIHTRGSTPGPEDLKRYRRATERLDDLPPWPDVGLARRLRATAAVLHPTGDPETIADGIETLTRLLTDTDTVDPETRLSLANNTALGLERTGRVAEAWALLESEVANNPWVIGPLVLHSMARLVPRVDKLQDEKLIADLLLGLYLEAPPESTARTDAREALRSLLGEQKLERHLDGLSGSSLHLAPPTAMVVDGASLQLFAMLAPDDSPLGPPSLTGTAHEHYDRLKFACWKNADEEPPDVIALFEGDRLVKLTSYRPGSSVSLRSLAQVDERERQVFVGMARDALESILKRTTLNRRPVRTGLFGRELFGQTERLDTNLESWHYLPDWNLGVLIENGVVTGLSVTPATLPE